jgi:hypothetical protein
MANSYHEAIFLLAAQLLIIAIESDPVKGTGKL